MMLHADRLEDIKNTALALLNAPRKWGKGLHTLPDLIGMSLREATKSTPLDSEAFERLRSELVQTVRGKR
jgi:hypothetical protein